MMSRILKGSLLLANKFLSHTLERPKRNRVGGSLGFSNTLEAMHKRLIKATDEGKPSESSVVVMRRKETIIGYRFDDSQGKSIAVDSTPSELVFNLTGKSRQNEQGIQSVCTILMQKLNHDGAHWQTCTDVSRECGKDPEVDCEFSDGANVLRVQVTRAHFERSFWKALTKQKTSSRTLSPESAADILKQSIEAKAKCPQVQRQRLILALDATETPSHAFEPVIRSFIQRYGHWATSLCYISIWLVGPNVTLTARLDKRSHL